MLLVLHCSYGNPGGLSWLLFPLNVWQHLPEITSSSCSSWEEESQKRLVWRGVTVHQMQHRITQDCSSDRIHSLSATIQHTLPDPLLRGDLSVLWRWEPHSSALVEDVTPEGEQRWRLCLWKYFFPFLFCRFCNLQSLSICLCRRINLWYALYTWHLVTFFA